MLIGSRILLPCLLLGQILASCALSSCTKPDAQDSSVKDVSSSKNDKFAINHKQAHFGRSFSKNCYDTRDPNEIILCGTSLLKLEHFDDAPIYAAARPSLLRAYGEDSLRVDALLDVHERRLSTVKGLPPAQFEAGLQASVSALLTDIDVLCHTGRGRRAKLVQDLALKFVGNLSWMEYRLWLMHPAQDFNPRNIDRLLQKACLKEIRTNYYSDRFPRNLNSIYQIPPHVARSLSLYAHSKLHPALSKRWWLLAELQDPKEMQDACFEQRLDRKSFEIPYTTPRSHLLACLIKDDVVSKKCAEVVDECLGQRHKPPW